LPLTVFAAISMGTRVAQYGLSPERLWALVAIVVAVAYGLAALVAVIRGKLWGWRPYLRSANLNLAIGVSVLALILALPILDFGAISAANQVSRLERGKVSAKDFDYDALKWDFGESGRRALAKLTKSGNADIARLAKEAQARKQRRWYWDIEQVDDRDKRLANVHFQFDDPALRKDVEEFVRREPNLCNQPCVVLDVGPTGKAKLWLAVVTSGNAQFAGRDSDGVLQFDYALGVAAPVPAKPRSDAEKTAPGKAVPKVEVRSYTARQIYVDGEPVGQPFE